MREIGCCQLGVSIPSWKLCRVPLFGRSYKQTNKQTPQQTHGFLESLVSSHSIGVYVNTWAKEAPHVIRQ